MSMFLAPDTKTILKSVEKTVPNYRGITSKFYAPGEMPQIGGGAAFL